VLRVLDPRVKETRYQLSLSLKLIDGWLSQHQFVAGPEISIADLSLCCELSQLACIKTDELSGYPRVREWMGRVAALPSYAAAHKVLYRMAERLGGVGPLHLIASTTSTAPQAKL